MTDILDLQIASPTFGGSTGGWLRAVANLFLLLLFTIYLLYIYYIFIISR